MWIIDEALTKMKSSLSIDISTVDLADTAA